MGGTSSSFVQKAEAMGAAKEGPNSDLASEEELGPGRVGVGRDKGVKHVRKVPHTPYVCGTMAIATMRTHTYGGQCCASILKAYVKIQRFFNSTCKMCVAGRY